jgi:hypothetical protein
MSVAATVVEMILTAEGRVTYEDNAKTKIVNVWGLQSNFLNTYAKGVTYTALLDNAKGKDLARNVLSNTYYAKGFGGIGDQETANFMFDTWFHNKTLFTALISGLLGKSKQEFIYITDRDKPLDWVSEINQSTTNKTDKENFLGAAKWMRRRLARVYWRKGLWKGFDQKRFSKFPYVLSCMPTGLSERLRVATFYLKNAGHWLEPTEYPKEYSFAEIDNKLAKTELALRAVERDAIGDPFIVDSCDVSSDPVYTPLPDEPTGTGFQAKVENDNTLLYVAGAAVVLYFVLKKSR